MTMNEILRTVRSFADVLELAPAPGSEYPEIAWGDHFFYYSPDGTVPERTQPHTTIITKNYPDDSASRLNVEGRWRLNIQVGRDRLDQLLGERREGAHGLARGPDAGDPAAGTGSEWDDTLLPHPLYGSSGWISVVNPSRLIPQLGELLRLAHEDQGRRLARRRASAVNRSGGDGRPGGR